MHAHTKVTLSNTSSSFSQPVQQVLPFPKRLVSLLMPQHCRVPHRQTLPRGRHTGSRFFASYLQDASAKRQVTSNGGQVGQGFGIVIKSQKHPIKFTSPSPEPVDLHINQRQQSNPHWKAAISDCLHACTVSLASSQTHSLTQTQTHLPSSMM